MTVLVTGGTGFLGEHTCAALVEGGAKVRVLARSRSGVLDELGVELVRGDVTSADDCAKALAGVTQVFHLAGVVSRDPDDGQRMMRTHVDGTRHLLQAIAKAGGIERVVVASTSGTIAVSKRDEVLDETAGYAEELVAGWPYYVSKIYQERLAFDLGASLGLEIVCVNPSILYGPGDRRMSSTGDIRRFLRGQIPIIPRGGINFVDARDAAAATVAAMTKGRPGERYLLGGPNWTMKQFFGRLARVAKVRGPWLKLPEASWIDRAQRAGASMVESMYRSRGKEPPLDRISVEMSEHFWWFDSGKAARELGFTSRDPALTLHDTVAYLRRDLELV